MRLFAILLSAMIPSLIRELSQLSRAPKLDQAQMERAYGLMRKMRELGFTNHELSVIFRKVAEASIKRNTRGVEVRDTVEHDQILEKLTDFADRGYEVADIGEYKDSREVHDKAGLTFVGCARLAGNLLRLGVDAGGLLELSDELTAKDLTAKSIRANIDLNDELKTKGITEETQEEILAAAKSYGDPPTILELVNAAGGLTKLASEQDKIRQDVSEANAEKDRVESEKKRLEAENLAFRSYVDIVKLLVTKHGFDISSFNELLSLAEKHGDPVQVIRAVNVYNDSSELDARQREAQVKLQKTEKDLASKEVVLKVKEDSLAKANQLIGEIRMKHAQSLRLQIVSDLITNPKEVKATVDELARITLAVLMGVNEFIEQNKQESEKFRNKTGSTLKWLIEALQDYLR
jgi:hypothetical protein